MTTFRIYAAIGLAWALAATASAQTRIPPRAVVNAASFARPGLPQGAIARGSIFTIFGQNIGPDSAAAVSEFPLEESLSGVTIQISQGETTVAAIPVFAAANQINAILPSDAPLGRASLLVRNGVRRSNPVPVEIVESQLGVFTANGTGFGPGIAQNFESQTVQPINAPARPATRGQLVTIWATGLGPVDFPDNEAPVPGNLAVDLRVWIGGVRVPEEDLLYFGRSPCCAGVDQIIVRIPEAAPLGCYVPLEIQAGDGPPANSVTLAISSKGEACRPAGAGPAQAAPLETAQFFLGQARVSDIVDRPAPLDYSFELGAARFRRSDPGPFPFDTLTAIPPAGSCLSYNFAGGFEALYANAAGEPLDAGPQIRSQGPRGVARWPSSDGFAWDYSSLLGGETSALGFLEFLVGPYLLPGVYRLSAGGGGDVGPFDVEAQVPAELDWSNREEIGMVDRSTDLEIAWAAPGEGVSEVLILGGARDLPHDASYVFVCAADPQLQRFAVPQRILAGAPASRAEAGQSIGFFYVGASSGAQPLTIEGLDAAAALAAAGQAKTVLWE